MAKKGQASRLIVWGILGLLVVGLIGFGTTDFGGRVQSVGRVGTEDINVNDYARELQGEIRALSAQTGQTLSFAEARAFGIDRAVLSRLVNRAALDNETARLGISVGDGNVRDRITRISAFQGVDGNFDREAYEFALQNSGLTVAEFEERIRKEAARTVLQAAVASGTPVPDIFTDTLYAWARETRDITWARLGPDDLAAALPEPTDADLTAFHAANEETFTLGETKAITHAWITPEMILDSIELDEDALRAAYDERIDDYVQPERRLVERLVFADEAAARDAKAAIDAGGTSFEDLVAERDLDLADIDMGDVSRRDLGEAADGVFALDGPGIAGPLPSALGPALYRVNAILEATEVPFDEAKDDLATELAADRAARVIDGMRDDLDDLLAAGATIEELADETEMELGRIDWREGVTTGIAAHQAFREAAQRTAADDFPELAEIEGGGLFVLRVDEVRPPAVQPLGEIRDEVAAAWQTAEARKRLTARAEDTAQAIRDGAEMAGLDLPLRTERGMTREAFLDDAPDGMVAEVFAMAAGAVRVVPTEDGAALVRLDAVHVPDPDDTEAQALKERFAAQASQGLAADAMGLYGRALQGRAGTEINAQTLDAVHAQFQ